MVNETVNDCFAYSASEIFRPILNDPDSAIGEATAFTKFSSALSVSYDEEASDLLEKDYYQVNQAFKYYVGDKEDDTWIYVPQGFLTDGASVPNIFWVLIPPWGRYGAAAVVHDFLCEYLTVWVRGVPTKVDREYADKIFLEAMTVLEVPEWKRTVMYYAVRTYATVMGISDKPSVDPDKKALETKRRLEHVDEAIV